MRNLKAPMSLHSGGLLCAKSHEQGNAEISTLTPFITAQSTGWECPSTFTSVRKLNTGFSADSDRALVQVSSLHLASQKYIPASLRARFLQLYLYSLLDSPSGERQIHDFREMICTRHL